MPTRLTPRQDECLRLTRLMTDREIAMQLRISEPTVKKHVLEACQRMGVNRRKVALAMLEAEDTNKAVAPSSAVGEPTLAAPAIVAAALVSGRMGYRPPPRDPFIRAVMIAGVTVVCAVMVGALTEMVASQHRQVRSIEVGIGTLPPTPPSIGTAN